MRRSLRLRLINNRRAEALLPHLWWITKENPVTVQVSGFLLLCTKSLWAICLWFACSSTSSWYGLEHKNCVLRGWFLWLWFFWCHPEKRLKHTRFLFLNILKYHCGKLGYVIQFSCKIDLVYIWNEMRWDYEDVLCRKRI